MLKKCIHDFMTDPLYYIALIAAGILMGVLLMGAVTSIINSLK
jgi:hypothetical protein